MSTHYLLFRIQRVCHDIQQSLRLGLELMYLLLASNHFLFFGCLGSSSSSLLRKWILIYQFRVLVECHRRLNLLVSRSGCRIVELFNHLLAGNAWSSSAIGLDRGRWLKWQGRSIRRQASHNKTWILARIKRAWRHWRCAECREAVAMRETEERPSCLSMVGLIENKGTLACLESPTPLRNWRFDSFPGYSTFIPIDYQECHALMYPWIQLFL